MRWLGTIGCKVPLFIGCSLAMITGGDVAAQAQVVPGGEMFGAAVRAVPAELEKRGILSDLWTLRIGAEPINTTVSHLDATFDEVVVDAPRSLIDERRSVIQRAGVPLTSVVDARACAYAAGLVGQAETPQEAERRSRCRAQNDFHVFFGLGHLEEHEAMLPFQFSTKSGGGGVTCEYGAWAMPFRK